MLVLHRSSTRTLFLHYYRKHGPSRVDSWPRNVHFLKYLSDRDPNFLTIQSIATAYKHLYPHGEFHEIGSPMALEGVLYRAGETEVKHDWEEGGGEVVV